MALIDATGTAWTAQDNPAPNKAWAATTAFALADVIFVASAGHYYRVVAAGTSAGSQPTWPTTNSTTVTDGTVTWAEAGQSWLPSYKVPTNDYAGSPPTRQDLTVAQKPAP